MFLDELEASARDLVLVVELDADALDADALTVSDLVASDLVASDLCTRGLSQSIESANGNNG